MSRSSETRYRDGSLTNETLVRAGHAGLALPEYRGIFSARQQFPVRDTRRWIDVVFNVNEHLKGIGDYTSGGQIVLPPTANLAIQSIRRGTFRSAYISGASTAVRGHEILATPTEAGGDFAELLTFHDQTYDGTTFVGHRGEKMFSGNLFKEAKARGAIQGVVQEILLDLGYGLPDEFAAHAIPYGDYREAHPVDRGPRHFPLPVPKPIRLG